MTKGIKDPNLLDLTLVRSTDGVTEFAGMI